MKTDTDQTWRGPQDWDSLRPPFWPSPVTCCRGECYGPRTWPSRAPYCQILEKTEIFHTDLLNKCSGNVSLIIYKLPLQGYLTNEAFLISAVNLASTSLCPHRERNSPQVWTIHRLGLHLSIFLKKPFPCSYMFHFSIEINSLIKIDGYLS